MRKYTSIIVTVIILALCMPLAITSAREIGKFLGLQPVVVSVVGTGSMYPSLFWEKSEGGPDDESTMSVEEYRTTPHMYRRFDGVTIIRQTFFKKSIGFGDMVAFKNSRTESILTKEGKDSSSGFIKRIIGLPGDTVELRDGYVVRNGEQIAEPYIYRPRSTYGSTYLPDCTLLVVPADSYFVLGDNRKISSDSRGELGLVGLYDISYVLPYSEQNIYHSLWRDTSRDQELSGTPTLSAQEFYTLVNETRREHKVGTLTPDSVLTTSASLRGHDYLGKKSLDLASSMKKAGYNNILVSEFITPGHYTAQELLQNLLYSSDTSKQILDTRYDEIGVAAITQTIDGCPTQVIVGQLGGYLPPEYEADTIKNWTQLRENLEDVIPSWEAAVGSPHVDQSKLNELLTLLRRRLNLAREIEGVMRDNKWLTDEQQARIKSDNADADQADQLAKELNKK